MKLTGSPDAYLHSFISALKYPENGNAVSAGIYLLRLNTAGYSETKKLSVIK